MQEKKNKQRLVLLLALIVITAMAFVWARGSGNSAIDKDVFRKADLQTVDRVLMIGKGDTVEISYRSGRWMVNGIYAADQNLVTVLFATLRQAEPKRPVSASMKDSVASQMQNEATRVMLYSRGEKLMNFQAGGNETQTQSLFRDETTGEIYVMTIPGYRVYVSGIFGLDENGWRDKFLLASYNWRNFQLMQIDFADKPTERYQIQINNGTLQIPGLDADTAKLNKFVNDFSLIQVDRYETAAHVADSLTLVKPSVVFTLQDVAGQITTLALFPGNKRQTPGLLNNDQAVFFNSRQISEILRPKSFFKKKA